MTSELEGLAVADVALTGAGGFLGWHTRAALRERDITPRVVALGDRFDQIAASGALQGTSRVVHLAGVNRASDEVVREGNRLFADQLAVALRRADTPPSVVVYANSTQARNGTVYGDAKARAGDTLAAAASEIGAEYVDLHLPNLFGEHGRPHYNAVTATFSHTLAQGGEPIIQNDKDLTLLHAQNAADLLIGNVPPSAQPDLEEHESVSGLLRRLIVFAQTYRAWEIPDVSSVFDRDLFNTYRSYTFPSNVPIKLTRHADGRGSFFETIRSHGGPSQCAFSTTNPGISRGDHFHRRKIERFTVLAGWGTISLRRLFTDEVFDIEVDGDQPVAVDMPTMWTHRIVNTGVGVLYTSFWTNDIFNPAAPDTIAEVV